MQPSTPPGDRVAEILDHCYRLADLDPRGIHSAMLERGAAECDSVRWLARWHREMLELLFAGQAPGTDSDSSEMLRSLVQAERMRRRSSAVFVLACGFATGALLGLLWMRGLEAQIQDEREARVALERRVDANLADMQQAIERNSRAILGTR